MGAEPVVATQLLILAGLLGATAEYSVMIRRRAARRRIEAERRAFEATGLRGLVRVFLTDR